MFDVIVIGAGAAGCVIATRVSERTDRRVLLIEAGPDYPASLPADLNDGTRNSLVAHDWGFRGRTNPKMGFILDYPRGRVVGGSSAVNTCIALRGEPEDYDEWNLDEWRFEKCLPAFKRLERDLDFQDEWHGSNGPVPIRRHPDSELVPWQRAFVAAARAEGYAHCPDPNRPGTEGVGPHAMNKVNGERMSAARCYLTAEVRARENLTLRPLTLVRRVIVKNGRAVAVEVETRGAVSRIEAKTIVLASGAVSTPGILLRSGLGPEDSVLRVGAELVREVPGVAEQIFEHPGAALFFYARRGTTKKGDPLIQTVLRTGNIQLQPGSSAHMRGVPLPLVALMCHVRKPRGVGRIIFTSDDPQKGPRLDFDALEHDDDRRDVVEAMSLAVKLFETPHMRPLAAPFFPRASAWRDRHVFETWLRRWSGTGFHPSGTVPMGKSTDQYGRVLGVEGLIVADASLMPTIPSSNIHIPTLMMGERFGEWLRDGSVA